jgi:hypothetical protein
MGQRTSAYLYGSASTGHWVPSRSDLDLLILVSEADLGLLEQKIETWKSSVGSPILDGFAVFQSGYLVMSKRLEEFSKPAYPVTKDISLIELWIIKNRSSHLFGTEFVSHFPQIEISALQEWAKAEIKRMFGSLRSSDIPELEAGLSGLIWSVSLSARLIMLCRGNVCESKRQALQWLADEHIEIRDILNLVLIDYSKLDQEKLSITSEQSLVLRRFCLELMQREVRLP